LKLVGGTNPPEILPEALSALRAYHWPGNVRQLRNCLERAVILANNGQITVSELPPEVVRAPFLAPPSIPAQPGAQTDNTVAVAGSGPLSLREVERQQILSALEQTGWHRGKTAELLGISPSTLYRRLRDYNLEHRG
jgi:DNA-binding NtrC family response regulator